MLRQRLLDTKLYADNDFLTKYINICTNPENNLNLVREKHHIFSRLTAKLLNQELDDSIDNIVELDICNHCLAHYYLVKCSLDSRLKFGNMLCLQLITHRNFNLISEQWILDNIQDINDIRLELRRLNSQLLIGLLSGLKNGNCRYDLEKCSQVKELLLEKTPIEYIIDITGVSKSVIQAISKGQHWSCEDDKFSCPYITKAYAEKIALKKEKLKALEKWLSEIHYCKQCGCIIKEYVKSKVGDGQFCSKHCAASWACHLKFAKDPQLAERMISLRRSYKGELNPNYGKKASDATRLKISLGIKASEGCKNSKRFKGKKHSEESRLKTSNSLKITHAYKRALKQLLEKYGEEIDL